MLFPSFCCGCKTLGPYLCERCYEKLQFYPLPISIDTLRLETVYLDQLIAAVEYEPTIGSLLHYLKYKHAREIGEYCGDLLYFSTFFPMTDFITATPLHPSRRSDRGYNQSEVIAQRLAKYTHVPYRIFLRRTKVTASQASLKEREKRLSNLANIFAFSHNPELIINKRILLIDDVCTTGTTLNECARILKKAGAKQVVGLVVAHGQ